MSRIALVKMKKASYEQKSVDFAIKEAFKLMGYDVENIDTPQWNPLKEIIKPGDSVLIKPNMVMHYNANAQGGIECLYTQPSVVKKVLEYVVLALMRGDGGKVVIADAPMQECDFEQLINKSGYRKMVNDFREKYPSIIFELKDLRGVKSICKNGVHYYQQNTTNNMIVVHLDKDSEFANLPPERLAAMRVTNYDPDIMRMHHNEKCHEYAVAQEVLDADVIINMPKPKTHRKAGITAALKNMVGINARKEYLPHHTNGEYTDENKSFGGDAYKKRNILQRIETWLLDWRNRFAQKYNYTKIAWILTQLIRVDGLLIRCFYNENFSEGSWYGNHTISKTITDLNKIIFYAQKNGEMIPNGIKARKYLIVADMIIAGDGEGPVAPSPNPIGVIGIGDNPVTFDEVVATLYGAKMEYMHTINQARGTATGKYPLIDEGEIGVIFSNHSGWHGKTWQEINSKDKLSIVPTEGWKKAFYD